MRHVIVGRAFLRLCPWCEQVRSVVLAVIFGSVFSIIIHKLNLTSGVIPSMGMAIALINFFSVQSWNALLKRFNINTLPFTPQVIVLLPKPNSRQ